MKDDLQYEIKADASQAHRAITGLHGDISKLDGGFTGLGTTAKSSLGGVVPVAAAAAASVAAVGTAVFGAAAALFRLTSSAAEYGSAIHDAAQRTGASAETISALKYAADTSGSSLENISGSVAKFNVLLGEANQGSSKAAATLHQYGITAKDTNEALIQAIRVVSDMTSADQQAAAAKALFKDRTGEILPVIKSFSGDLPGLINKLEDLGVIMGGQATKASDEFGDALDTLTMQATGLGRQFAVELMPMMTGAMEAISKSLAANKGEARLWGSAIVEAAEGANLAIGFFVKTAERNLAIFDAVFGTSARKTVTSADFMREAILNMIPPLVLLRGLAAFFGTPQAGAQAGGLVNIPDLPVFPKSGPGGAAKRVSGVSPKDDSEKQARDEFQRKVDGFRRQIAEYESVADRILAEQDVQLQKGVIDELRYGEIRKQVAERIAKFKVELLNRELRAARELGQATVDIESRIFIANEDLRGTFAKNQASRIEKINDAEKKYAKDQADRHEDERQRNAEQGKWHLEALDRIEAEWKAARAKDAKEAADQSKKTRQSQEAGSILGGPGIGGGIAAGMGVGLPSIWKTVVDEFGHETEVMKDQAEYMKSIYADVADFAGGAIGSMVDGLAQMGAAWLTTGEFSAKAALGMIASTALSISQQAGMKALFSYAEGVSETAKAAASAAAGDFRGAALHTQAAGLHFAAATKFGVIAAVAGGVGVAAGLGARAAGGGSGGGGGGGKDGKSKSNSSTNNDEESDKPKDQFTSSSGTFEQKGPVFGAMRDVIERLRDSSRIDAPITAPLQGQDGLKILIDTINAREAKAVERDKAIIRTLDKNAMVNAQLEETTNQFKSRIEGVEPGEIVRMGAPDASEAIMGSISNELKSDSRATETFKRGFGEA